MTITSNYTKGGTFEGHSHDPNKPRHVNSMLKPETRWRSAGNKVWRAIRMLRPKGQRGKSGQLGTFERTVPEGRSGGGRGSTGSVDRSFFNQPPRWTEARSIRPEMQVDSPGRGRTRPFFVVGTSISTRKNKQQKGNFYIVVWQETRTTARPERLPQFWV